MLVFFCHVVALAGGSAGDAAVVGVGVGDVTLVLFVVNDSYHHDVNEGMHWFLCGGF